MKAYRLISAVVVILGILVTGRYAWAKYLSDRKDMTLQKAVQETKDDLFNKGKIVSNEFEKVLGEEDEEKDLSTYLKEDLPKELQKKVQESEVVKEIQKEVIQIIESTTTEVQQMPQEEIDKLKKGVAQEICTQLMEAKEATESGEN